MRQAGLMLAALLAFCGCGNDGGWSNVIPTARQVFARSEPGPDLRTTLTPDSMASLNQPLLLAELPKHGVQAGLLLVATNGRDRTWFTQDNISLTFRSGLLAETRGLGGDLMSTDLGEVAQGVFDGRAQGVRVHRYLDGDDQIVMRAFVCDYNREAGVETTTLAGTYRTTHVIEDCAGLDSEIVNHYWIDGRGFVRKSLQWVGPVPGYVATELLRDK